MSFEIVDRNTGQFLSFPLLAKVGAPRTAFYGCGNGADNTVANAGVCQTFLTDDSQVSTSLGSLRVEYTNAVPAASGVLLDIDGTEQWTVTAFDGSGSVVDVAIVDHPTSTPCGGTPGNGTASQWSVQAPGAQSVIRSLRIDYTGVQNVVGVAFDNFSPSEGGLGSDVTGCVPTANSTLEPALTFASGSPLAADNQFHLTTQGLPTSTFGYYLTSPDSGPPQTPMASQGPLCLTGPIGRLNSPAQIQMSGACGIFSLSVDLQQVPTPTSSTAVAPGETWYFQCWYRDMNPGSTSNFSSAVEVGFL
ncbi:MAG: hypothetical protein GY711_34700 [bacterium]|nr:hypothetical protein [bacterium]